MDFDIGKRYDFRTHNCWDYVRNIRLKAGLTAKKYNAGTLESAFEMITSEMQKLGNGLTKVDNPNNLDVVIGYKNVGKRLSYHCGIFYDNQVIHCDRKMRQVVAQSAQDFYKGFDGVKFWR